MMSMIMAEYFKKIELQQKPIATLSPKEKLEYLTQIYQKHQSRFAYSNFALRTISPEHPVQRRSLKFLTPQELLNAGHGYCLENAQLLFCILNNLGFEIFRSLASVLNGLPVNSKELFRLPVTHMLLVVTIAGERFYLDPGLAPRSPRLPLKIDRDGQVIHQDYDQFKFCFIDNVYVFERLQAGSWVQILQTDLKPIDDQLVARTVLKLERFPDVLGIRDCKTVVGKITATGSKCLFWDSASKKITYSVEDQGQYQKEVLADAEAAQSKLEKEFAIHGVPKAHLEKMCTDSKTPLPKRRWSLALTQFRKEDLEEMSVNVKL